MIKELERTINNSLEKVIKLNGELTYDIDYKQYKNRVFPFNGLIDMMYSQNHNDIDYRAVQLLTMGTVINTVGRLFGDDEIIKLSNEFEVKEPIIIDYENNRRYKFMIDVDKRITQFNTLKYLYDIDLSKYENYRLSVGGLVDLYDE